MLRSDKTLKLPLISDTLRFLLRTGYISIQSRSSAVRRMGRSLVKVRPSPATIIVALITLLLIPALLAQSPPARVPSARLIRVPAIALPSLVDSNSPAVWELIEGQQRLFVFTSESGSAIRHEGSD